VTPCSLADIYTNFSEEPADTIFGTYF
jgi:hypothetical protein